MFADREGTAMTFYGSDTYCINDLPLVDTQVTDPVQLIGQRIVRRLSTPRGALALIGDDPNFGYDVRQWINNKAGPGDIALAQAAIESECLKDEQIIGVTASIAFSANTSAMTVTLQLVTGVGPFTLTLNVNQLTVDMVFNF
jgi:hypothetical protein